MLNAQVFGMPECYSMKQILVGQMNSKISFNFYILLYHFALYIALYFLV